MQYFIWNKFLCDLLDDQSMFLSLIDTDIDDIDIYRDIYIDI